MDNVFIYLSKIFKNDYLIITILAAFPLVELKGSILIGIAKKLPLIWVFCLSYLGSCIVVPIVLLFLKPIIELIKRIKPIQKLVQKIELRLESKATKFESKNNKTNHNKGLILALFLFVAFPAPMTGVWSGATIAAFLNINYTKALFAILLGNFVSGIIVFCIALFFQPYTDIIFMVFLIIALACLVISIITPLIRKMFRKYSQKHQSNTKFD